MKNPYTTPFFMMLKSKKISTEGRVRITAFTIEPYTLILLVGQAVFAADLFLNTNQIVNKLDEIYSKLLKQKSNIVLVGMPASGKSTVAKQLGKTLGLSVYDTDELIVKKFGNISNIFEKYGEAYFRKLETEIINEVSKLGGVIIATGGGAVLSKENVNALKQNGKFFFLNRPLEELLPTEDRPLANDKDKIISLYNQRIDIYKSVADVTVSVTNNPLTAVKEILTNF
jgi:shikimate dehydrogenase